MALTTFSGDKPRAIGRAATGAIDILTEIEPPAWGRTLVITFEANAGKITHVGTDGVLIGGAAFETVAAGVAVRIPITEGRDGSIVAPVFVTSATAATAFSVGVEARGP